MLSPSSGEHEIETSTDIANGTSFLAMGALDAVVRGMPSPWVRVERHRGRYGAPAIVNYSQSERWFMTLLEHLENAAANYERSANGYTRRRCRQAGLDVRRFS